MSARSRSEASFTSSRAEYSELGSIRMSSGASAAYEKPRSGRSICIDETPRSSSTMSARTPLPASCCRTAENSPWWRRALMPVSRRNRSKNGATVGSRSIAITFPSPRSRCASSVACPPAPKVPSTIVSPGRGSSAATTSSARTGTWSVSVGKTLGNIFRAPFDLVQLCAPGGAIPDLEVVGRSGHRDLLRDPGPREQRRGYHEPALFVELAAGRAGEEEPAHAPPVDGERVDGVEALRQLRPRVDGPGEEATVESARHDDAFLERRSELRRECEAVLLIQRMLVLAQQHGPLRSTLNHFPPLGNPNASRRAPGLAPVGVRLLLGDELDGVAEPHAAGLCDRRVHAERQALGRLEVAAVGGEGIQGVEVGPARIRVLLR